LKLRRQFEVIESRQMDHLRVFHDVARTLTTTLQLEEILLAIMQKMAAFFGPERWSLLMVDDEAKDLYYAIAVGEDENSLKGLRVPLGQGVAGWVASTGNPLVVPNVSLDPHWSTFARNHPDLKIASIACVPIRSGETTLGVIQLLNSKLDLLSEYSISFFLSRMTAPACSTRGTCTRCWNSRWRCATTTNLCHSGSPFSISTTSRKSTILTAI
jgi:transcriptional regulator with GAF, ATPase, and Fis domain